MNSLGVLLRSGTKPLLQFQNHFLFFTALLTTCAHTPPRHQGGIPKDSFDIHPFRRYLVSDCYNARQGSGSWSCRSEGDKTKSALLEVLLLWAKDSKEINKYPISSHVVKVKKNEQGCGDREWGRLEAWQGSLGRLAEECPSEVGASF